MADLTTYLNRNVGSGDYDGSSPANGYDDFVDMQTGEARDLTSDTDTLTVNYRTTGGASDTTDFTQSGWTLSSSYWLKFEAESGYEAVKTAWDSGTRYQFVGQFIIRNGWTYLYNLQVQGNSWSNGVKINYCSTGDIYIQYCRFSGASTNNEPIEVDDTDPDVYIYCNIIDDTGASQGSGDHAIQVINSNSCEVYNNTIRGFYDGINISGNGNNVTIRNNIILDCDGSDLNDSDTSDNDYNIADEAGAQGTNGAGPSGGSWSNEIADYSTGDFTLQSSGNADGGGTNVSITYDIDGDNYATPPSCGCDEISSGGDTVLVVQDIDIGLDVALDTFAITVQADLVTVNDIDIGLDIALDTFPLEVQAYLTVQEIDIGLDIALDNVGLTSQSLLSVDDIDIGLDISLDAFPLSVQADLVTVNNIDIGLDIALDAFPLSAQAFLTVQDIDIGLDIALDNIGLVSQSTLAIDDIDIGLDIALDNVSLVLPSTTLTVQDIDIGLEITLDNIIWDIREIEAIYGTLTIPVIYGTIESDRIYSTIEQEIIIGELEK